MRYLIVNADDFGYTPGVNRGIIDAHTRGIVTSTSVMVDGVAALEAADLALFDNLSVGLHFVASGTSDFTAELERQVDVFMQITGKAPDHIDTHKMQSTDHPVVEEVLRGYSRTKHVPVRRLGTVKYINSYFGMRGDGDLSVDALKLAIDAATDSYNELMCHVGYSDEQLRTISSYNDMREQELAAITDPSIRRYVDNQPDLELITWKQVTSRQIIRL